MYTKILLAVYFWNLNLAKYIVFCQETLSWILEYIKSRFLGSTTRYSELGGFGQVEREQEFVLTEY